MELFRKPKEELQQVDGGIEMQQQAILMGANLEVLRDLKERLDKLYLKMAELERKIEERIPEKVLSETTFKQEIVDSEEVIQKIISELKTVTRPLIASKQQLTIVESKKIEKIVSILQEHGKLSSSQLAQFTTMSRTRCNEYFKQMEELNLVEGIEIGKEKYYRLKD